MQFCGLPFVFLAVGLDLSRLDLPCACHHNCTHPVGGRTFGFSSIPFLLVRALAREFDQALRGESRLTSLFALRTEVLENTVLNDIVSSVRWCKPVAWSWCAAAHINILESASIFCDS